MSGEMDAGKMKAKMTETTRSSDQNVSLELETEKVNRHGHKRLSHSAVKLWLATGGLVGAGMLPCPDCGTPMILHVWPLVGFVLIARAIKKRAQGEELNSEQNSEDKRPQ